MRSTPVYEVHAVKYAHLPRKAWEVQITPDPHDADFPMDYFVWVAIPLDESGNRLLGGKPIVIDTGFNAQVGGKRGREVKTNPADLLSHLGIDAREIEDVIITHLHYDHVGNWDRFFADSSASSPMKHSSPMTTPSSERTPLRRSHGPPDHRRPAGARPRRDRRCR